MRVRRANLVPIREIATRSFNDWLDYKASTLSGKVPATEVATWDDKAAAIAAIAAARQKGETLAPNSRERLLLRIEAALVGVGEQEIEGKIARNAGAFRLVGPAISGERQRFQKRLAAAPSAHEIAREEALARARVEACLANLSAMAQDPEGFAATLPQSPKDLPDG